jgi:hypothetical protein
VGRCYILGYRTNYEAYSSKILLAEDIAQPVALTTTSGVADAPTADTFNPSSFQPEIAVYSDYLGNNCSFIYTAKLKENDRPRANCFYDVNKQYEMVDGVRKDVEKNQIIIDVRFDYIQGGDLGSSVNRSWRSVCDLSNIKRQYQYSENYDPTVSGDFVKVDVKFRYNQLQSNETVKEDVYFGSWTSSPCYFAYEKEQ